VLGCYRWMKMNYARAGPEEGWEMAVVLCPDARLPLD
jgi:hypothetical protein